MPDKSIMQERHLWMIHLQKLYQRFRSVRAEGCPRVRGDGQLFGHRCAAQGEKARQLRTGELSQSLKIFYPGMRVDLHYAEADLGHFLLSKPVKQLYELQLIVKIMLKPEHYFLKLAEIFQHA